MRKGRVGREAHAPFLFLTFPTVQTLLPYPPYPPDTQRSVKVSSMVICTGTACPMRVPGAKRHWRAAFIAS